MTETEDWGITDYREGWKRQLALRDALASGIGTERIVVTEHYAVFTLGFHGNRENLIARSGELEAIGAECIRIERGGDITYHGPGQLVAYPVIDLRKHRLGVKGYVHALEGAVMDVAASYGIITSTCEDAIGVWIDWGKPSARKLCAIGVKVSHGITMHGLALNVTTDLSRFRLINPCGFTDKPATSMAAELGYEPAIDEVKQRLIGALQKRLGQRD